MTKDSRWGLYPSTHGRRNHILLSRPQWSFVKSFIEKNVAHLSKTDFFGHNDMDMMEIGNGGLDLPEQRTHFAAWAFLKSPILLYVAYLWCSPRRDHVSTPHRGTDVSFLRWVGANTC